MDIEKEKARCKELIKESHSRWIGISNQKAIETVLSELDKKDKIINAMAKEMNKDYPEDIIANFTKKVEE